MLRPCQWVLLTSRVEVTRARSPFPLSLPSPSCTTFGCWRRGQEEWMRRSSSSSSTPDTTFHLEEGCAHVVAWSNGTQPPGGFHQVCDVVGIGGGGAMLPGHHEGRGQVGGEVEELAHQEGRAQVAHLELKVVLPVRSLHTWSMVLTLALTVAREEESSPYSTTTQSFSMEILVCRSNFSSNFYLIFRNTD